jgi:hypothetical protein
MFTIIKTIVLIALLALFTGNAMRIHRTSITDFLTHEGVPSLFKNMNTQSDEFKRLAQEELNKINANAGIISTNSKPKTDKPSSSSTSPTLTKPKSSDEDTRSTGVSTSGSTSQSNDKTSVSKQTQ